MLLARASLTRRVTVTLALMALMALVAAAGGCGSREGRTELAADRPTGSPVVAGSAASPGTAQQARPANTIALHDPAERATVAAALTSLGAHGVTISEEPLEDGAPYVVRAWAAVTGQRSDVLSITRAQLRAALEGRIDDWAGLGGTPAPLTVTVPADGATAIARLFAPNGLSPLVSRLPAGSPVLARAGTLALVAIDALHPGVLALVIDRHDPLRDPARIAPLRELRWVRAPNAATAGAVAAALGWDGALNAYDPVGVLASGDYVPVRCAWESMDAAGGPERALADVRPLLQMADLTIVRLESGLTSSTAPTPCEPTLTLVGPASAAESLARAGVDVVTRASNHAFDCWERCPPEQIRAETDHALANAGIAHAGTGADLAAARAPVIATRDGVSFAVLAYEDVSTGYDAAEGVPGVAHLDLNTLADDVDAARKLADHVIVAVHWGVEYTADPTSRQRAAARVAAEAGAALVIGNHPHWLQAVERIDDALVVYALGNFVFDQIWSELTQQGALLEVGFTRERMLGYRLRPLAIRDGYRPVTVDPAGDEGRMTLGQIWAATDRLPVR